MGDIRESSGEDEGLFLLSPSYGRVVRAYKSTLDLSRESVYNTVYNIEGSQLYFGV